MKFKLFNLTCRFFPTPFVCCKHLMNSENSFNFMVGFNHAAKIYCFCFCFSFIVESVNSIALVLLTGKNLTNF